RDAFVVAQVAFSILLVIVAGLFARALVRAGSLDPGFDSHGVELATVDPSIAGYTDTTGPLFAREMIERVRRMPRVEEATIAAVGRRRQVGRRTVVRSEGGCGAHEEAARGWRRSRPDIRDARRCDDRAVRLRAGGAAIPSQHDDDRRADEGRDTHGRGPARAR